MAQTSTILAKNQAILMQLQNYIAHPTVYPYVLAQASTTPPPTGSAPPPPALVDPLDVQATAVASATPPVAPQPGQVEDDSSPATD